jgi:sugar phosphate isomerase/epimerase
LSQTFPFAEYFGEIQILAGLQFMPGDKPYLDRPPAGTPPKELLLYLGCNVLRTAHLAKSAIAVLRAMGFDFTAVGGPAYCCGIVHFLHDQPASSARYSAGTIRHFGQLGARHVIMWCPSCNEHFDEVVTTTHTVPFEYEHMTAFLARHLDRIKFVRRVEKRVALHYHTGHPQPDRDRQHARAILEAIPGIEYVEIANPPELGRHCSPNYVAKLGQAAWGEHIRGVLERAEAAAVDVLATIYHSCHREICQEERGRGFEIVNYITLLAEAMGIEHPDVYKRYKLMGEPDAVFEAVRPYIEAHGLDPARVRAVLEKAFAPACEHRLPNPS